MRDPRLIAADPERLAALALYSILDTPAERGFDDAVAIAAHVMDAPIALVSLVAAERQWFKARIGIEAEETPLDQSVCSHVLETGDLLVIRDLTQDPRTSANALVTGAPFMRFYAGACLITPDDQPLGTICVIDLKPRPEGLSEDQQNVLRALARQVMDTLELRRLVSARDAIIEAQGREQESVLAEATTARRRELNLRLAIEATGVGVFDYDAATGLLDLDDRTRAFIGAPPGAEMSYDAMLDAFFAGDREVLDRAFKTAIDPAGKGVFEAVLRVAGADGETRWIEAQGKLIVADGLAERLIGTMRDVSARFRSDERQHLLNRELSHRMKNVLAMVQAIAAQTLRSTSDINEARDMLFSRLIAFSRAHDMLLSDAAVGSSLAGVVAEAVRVHQDRPDRFALSGPDLSVSAKSVLPLVLMMHELSTNALKYGALAAERGVVFIDWTIHAEKEGPVVRIVWREEGGPAVAPPSRTGFGTRLLERGIAGQLGAEVTLDYRPEGLVCTLHAPLESLQEED